MNAKISSIILLMTCLTAGAQTNALQTGRHLVQPQYRRAMDAVSDKPDEIKTRAARYVDELEASQRGSDQRANVIGRIWQSEDLPTQYKDAVLSEALRNDSGRPVETALTAISRMGENGKGYTDAVVAVLRDKEEAQYARFAALQALSKVADIQNTNALNALAGVLQENVDNLTKRTFTDYSSLDFAEAAKALGRFGPNASAKTNLISPLLTNRYLNIQFDAFVALSRIGNSDPARSEMSKEKLMEPDSYGYYVAIQNGNDELKEQAVPLILSILNEKSPGYLRMAGVETLAKLKIFDSRTIPFLLNSGPYGAYLGELRPEHVEAIPALVDGLTNSPEAGGRKVAAEKLCMFGPQAKAAVTPILEQFRKADASTDLEELGAYLVLLRTIGKDGAPVSEQLVAWLPQDASIYTGRSKLYLDYFRAYVLETLSHVGTPESALPYILDGLNNGSTHSFVAAARAAGDLGSKASVCVPALQKALNPDTSFDCVTFDWFMQKFSTRYTTAQAESIRALAKIGKDASPALPRLRELADGAQLHPGFDDKEYAKGLRYEVPDIQEEARKAVAAIETE